MSVQCLVDLGMLYIANNCEPAFLSALRAFVNSEKVTDQPESQEVAELPDTPDRPDEPDRPGEPDLQWPIFPSTEDEIVLTEDTVLLHSVPTSSVKESIKKLHENTKPEIVSYSSICKAIQTFEMAELHLPIPPGLHVHRIAFQLAGNETVLIINSFIKIYYILTGLYELREVNCINDKKVIIHYKKGVPCWWRMTYLKINFDEVRNDERHYEMIVPMDKVDALEYNCHCT